MFIPVSSPDALPHYSADDMTTVPVPEPSSLTFLSLALAGIGVVRRRGRQLKPKTAGCFSATGR